MCSQRDCQPACQRGLEPAPVHSLMYSSCLGRVRLAAGETVAPHGDACFVDTANVALSCQPTSPSRRQALHPQSPHLCSSGEKSPLSRLTWRKGPQRAFPIGFAGEGTSGSWPLPRGPCCYWKDQGGLTFTQLCCGRGQTPAAWRARALPAAPPPVPQSSGKGKGCQLSPQIRSSGPSCDVFAPQTFSYF